MHTNNSKHSGAMVIGLIKSTGLALVFGVLPWAAQAASITALGDLPGGSFNSRTFALSDDGVVAAGRSVSAGSGLLGEAYRWKAATGMVALGGGVAPFESQASGVSANGDVIVGNIDYGFEEYAVRWTEAAGVEDLGRLLEGVYDSAALDTSADGAVIVGRSLSVDSGPDGEAFRWTQPNGMVGLGFLPNASESQGLGVSDDGEVVVGWSDPGGVRQAFRWTEADGMIGLGDFPGGGIASTANAASADGSVVVGWGSSVQGREAFRWTQAGGLVGIGDLPGGGVLSEAFDVSGDGSVIVGQGTDDNFFQPFQAFIWDAQNGIRSLDSELASKGIDIASAGFTHLISAQAVSANGQFVAGWGQNSQGNILAFLADLGPEPETCTIDLNLNLQGGLLSLEFGLTSLQPAELNIFLSAYNQIFTLLASPVAVPVIAQPQFFAVPIPNFPDLDRIGVLATITSVEDGIHCSVWETVDTGK